MQITLILPIKFFNHSLITDISNTNLVLSLLLLPLLLSCRNQIDVNAIERRKHGLSYIKGTNQLVDGEVVRKMKGKIIEIETFENGKLEGPFRTFDLHGRLLSHGFSKEIKNYEKLMKGIDLSYCILNIVQATNDFCYATLYMDNARLFDQKEDLILLTRYILVDYSEKFKLDGLLILDEQHEFVINKSAVTNPNYTIDTISETNRQKLNFH